MNYLLQMKIKILAALILICMASCCLIMALAGYYVYSKQTTTPEETTTPIPEETTTPKQTTTPEETTTPIPEETTKLNTIELDPEETTTPIPEKTNVMLKRWEYCKPPTTKHDYTCPIKCDLDSPESQCLCRVTDEVDRSAGHLGRCLTVDDAQYVCSLEEHRFLIENQGCVVAQKL